MMNNLEWSDRLFLQDNSEQKAKNSAHYGIRTHAEFPPVDLESTALDRSAKCAVVTVLDPHNSLIILLQAGWLYEFVKGL